MGGSYWKYFCHYFAHGPALILRAFIQFFTENHTKVLRNCFMTKKKREIALAWLLLGWQLLHCTLEMSQNNRLVIVIGPFVLIMIIKHNLLMKHRRTKLNKVGFTSSIIFSGSKTVSLRFGCLFLVHFFKHITTSY